jgi:hypothetical protein
LNFYEVSAYLITDFEYPRLKWVGTVALNWLHTNWYVASILELLALLFSGAG